jgi:C-terminal processing protease CtpA/Prc
MKRISILLLGLIIGISPVHALTLQGQVTTSNIKGRIGVRIASDGGIIRVYDHSPAFNAGLLERDIILEADHIKGIKYIDGWAGTEAELKVKRGKEIFYIKVPRVPNNEVYDTKRHDEFIQIEDC